MHLPFELIMIFFLHLNRCMAAPTLAGRDADFESVRTRLDKSFVDAEPDHPNKYFHESTFHQHYDGRFADQPLKYDEKQESLAALIRTYLSTMRDIGVETWLMHGTLLGWYWNRKNMPWDSDLDVMVAESSIYFLASYYNMTIHHFRTRGSKIGRKYLLEINSHFQESELDKENRIDARWIDTDNGLFIDITTLRSNRTAVALGNSDAMMVKDNHHYTFDDIYPLRESEFEGTPVLLPFAYADVLIEEYGDHALSDVYHDNHHFDVEKDAWVPQKMVVLSSGYDEQKT
ncbi:Putative LicD family protein [Septoria linicola]|uniref:LicD family protein n=1 Tax=Septoria linicola TaxID=215465 RepID=A0A9Q9AGN9_9PEZI|nr:Putative LicD family protein [Septoria linicola]